MATPPHRLVCIGMSGIGKTYWSKQLSREEGYRRFGCDDEIAFALMLELERTGHPRDLAGWMGQPFSPDYRSREEQYMNAEAAVMERAIRYLSEPGDERRIVDTTGSVIYLPDDLLDRLSKTATIVLFDFTPALLDQMYQRFLAHPRPIVWKEHFAPLPSEGSQETLARCYPQLLAARHERYAKLAHITLPYEFHKKHRLSTAELLKAIVDE